MRFRRKADIVPNCFGIILHHVCKVVVDLSMVDGMQHKILKFCSINLVVCSMGEIIVCVA